MLINGTAFVMRNLLQPKPPDRAIQHAKELKVLPLRGTRFKFDNRSSLLEYLATSLEHKVIMGRHFAVCYGKIRQIALADPPIPCPPSVAKFHSILTTE